MLSTARSYSVTRSEPNHDPHQIALVKHTRNLFNIVVGIFVDSLFFLEPVESIRGRLLVMIFPA